jgi:hypothetical protein
MSFLLRPNFSPGAGRVQGLVLVLRKGENGADDNNIRVKIFYRNSEKAVKWEDKSTCKNKRDDLRPFL